MLLVSLVTPSRSESEHAILHPMWIASQSVGSTR